MLNKAKLFEALNAMTECRRQDALAILGYLLLNGPTEPRKLREVFRPFVDGHPLYLGSLLQILQEWGAIDYKPAPGPAFGVLTVITVPVFTDALSAQSVPFVVGHDVYRLTQRDRVPTAQPVTEPEPDLAS
jgi:hypothetical protein